MSFVVVSVVGRVPGKLTRTQLNRPSDSPFFSCYFNRGFFFNSTCALLFSQAYRISIPLAVGWRGVDIGWNVLNCDYAFEN